MKLKISNQKTGVSFDPYKHSMIMQILHIYFNNITLEFKGTKNFSTLTYVQIFFDIELTPPCPQLHQAIDLQIAAFSFFPSCP